MITPNYDIYRIDGPVLEDVEISVGEPNMRENITLLEGQYVTVIVLTNREAPYKSFGGPVYFPSPAGQQLKELVSMTSEWTIIEGPQEKE